MAESAAFARRTIKGGAALAHIPGGLASGVTGVVAADDLTSWAGATADGPTRVMVNREGATPEEIEVSSVSGNNITIAARGVGDTTDTTHGVNATIEIVSSPRDFEEANQLVNAILGIASLAAEDLLVLSSATTFKRLAKGSNGQGLGVSGGVLAYVDFLLKSGGTMTGELVMADQLLTRPLFKDYGEEVVAHGNTGTTETIDLEGGNVHTATLDNACTFTFSNPTASGDCCSFTLILTQDGTGSRVATWPASVKWAGGSAPTLSTAASAVDILTFVTVNGGTAWYGFLGGRGFA